MIRRTAAVLLTGGGLAVLGALLGPAGPASAAEVDLELYAVTGSTTMPGGQTVTVWGYNHTGGPATAPGGPTLTVQQGDVVTITLHNQLSEDSGLLLQGQPMVPDRTGVAGGGTKQYTFTAEEPGTYLYEAGLLPNAEHQVAMGLYGALVVESDTAGQAYAGAWTAYDDDAVLVLGEIDPALNNAANPAGFDMRKYAPRYFLVNGKAYPDTVAVPATGGDTVLLRYVNAGSTYHSMAVLGAHQSVVALDGSPLSHARRYVAETFGPGQTADAILEAPSVVGDLKLPVYDGSLLLHNTNTAGLGGMMTSIDVAGAAVGDDLTGPVTSEVAYGAGDVTATVDDADRGGSDVTAAEYFLDTVGAEGTGTSMTGAFGSPTEPVSLTVAVPTGGHILYVRGQDSEGNWGPVSSVLVDGGDAGGPTTKSPTLTPRLTNATGSSVISVSATGDDSASGGSAITAAEYFVDTLGADGTGVAMSVNQAAPIASLDGTIPAGVKNALAEGAHPIWIHARDAQGNWGDAIEVSLTVDKTAPSTSGLTVQYTPNNGTIPFSNTVPAVRVMATTLSDPISGAVNSPISTGELFIDTVGANGSGVVLRASDGVFNDPSEGGYADIPLATVKTLSNGTHTLHVHAKDEAGNWGPTATVTMVVDKVGPAMSLVGVAPNPTAGAGTATLTATATDALSALTAAEWFVGTDPGVGNATAITPASGPSPQVLTAPINTRAMSEGSYTVKVRAKDAAGNWGPTSSAVLNLTSSLFFSTTGNGNPPGVGGAADDADIYLWNGLAPGAFSRQHDLSTLGVPGGANVDGYSRVDATHFYVSFTGNVNLGGGVTVADEDIAYYNAGTWSRWFDGSTHGVGGAVDLGAMTVRSGTLYFSINNNAVPPGAGGPGDNADVYRWNAPGNSYTRVFNAAGPTIGGLPSAGLPAGANVDGLVYVDNTHLYLSFSGTTTTVPGLGAVQDEDVVFYNNGTWSLYFDGTAKGLTSNNLDLDAFDIP